MPEKGRDLVEDGSRSSRRWHIDGEANGKNSITISFGNRKDWCTQILDKEQAHKLFNNDLTLFGDAKKLGYSTGLIEPVSRNSDHGTFYWVNKLAHRSPLKDLSPTIQEDDYRIFLRFNCQKRKEI